MTCSHVGTCEILSDIRDPELIGTAGRSEKEYARELQEIFAQRENACRICRIARQAAWMEMNDAVRQA